MITVLCFGGIGESNTSQTTATPQGMLASVTQSLLPQLFRSVWVPWIDEYGPVPNWNGVSYEQTRAIGLQECLAAVASAVQQWGDPVLLLGYSAGAGIVGDAANALAAQGDTSVVGVATVADPSRPPAAPGGDYGIFASRVIDSPNVWSVYSTNDIIPYCSAGSALRVIPAITANFTVQNIAGWASQLAADISTVEFFQHPDLDWGAALLGLAGYVAPYPFGIHTGYDHFIMPGTALTYCAYLASELNAFAEAQALAAPAPAASAAAPATTAAQAAPAASDSAS